MFLPLLVLWGGSELLLRVVNFQYSDTPQKILSYPDWVRDKMSSDFLEKNQVAAFVKERRQFWVPQPSFEDRFSVEKPAGVTRIVALGCSCTQACAGSRESYADMMFRALDAESPGKYQVLNAGVGSYSSYQGLQRLKYVVAKYKPDYLTIFFGWNDHWIAHTPDHLIKIKPDWQIHLINVLEKSRVYQFLNYGVSLLFRNQDKAASASEPLFRVPAEEYEKNLNAMIDFSQTQMIRPILITAPYDMTTYRPLSLFPFSKEKLVEVHKKYNKIVRKVAEVHHVPLIDLEAYFEYLNTRTPGIYFSDGIHFVPLGCKAVADAIVGKLRDLFREKSAETLPKVTG